MRAAMRVRSVVCALGLVALVLAAGCGKKEAAPTAASVELTVKNLQAAFDGESNAKARYEAFAKKADDEGYHQVASLFRAAAASETIHAANLERILKGMNAEAKADVKAPQVLSTKENLEAALKGETYEKTTMYPDFIKQAQADKVEAAVMTFSANLAAETEHAKFYKEALDNLNNWKDGTRTFIVCSRCGFTSANLDLSKCPVCSEPKEGLKKVS